MSSRLATEYLDKNGVLQCFRSPEQAQAHFLENSFEFDLEYVCAIN
jgi:hypothetical protein